MTPVPGDIGAAEHVYTYRPSQLGAPWSFVLTPDAIAWQAGRRSGVVPYRDVRRVRLSFKPSNMQTQRYVMEIWAEAAAKLTVVSSSWKSLLEQERLDPAYVAFVGDLHARIAASGGTVVYETGRPAITYWPGLIVTAAVALGIALLFLRAVQSGVIAGALFIAAFLALFLWYGVNYFRRNRPGFYTPDALPSLLMPKITATKDRAPSA